MKAPLSNYYLLHLYSYRKKVRIEKNFPKNPLKIAKKNMKTTPSQKYAYIHPSKYS